LASLTAHLRAGAEHGRLGFHPACPRCRDERLAGNIDSEPIVSRRTQAVVAAGVLAVSTATPAVAVAAEPDQEQEGGGAPTPDGGSGGTVDDPAYDPGGDDTPLDVDVGPPTGSPSAGGDVDDGDDGTPIDGEDPDDPEGRLVLDEPAAEPAPTGGEPAPSTPVVPPDTDGPGQAVEPQAEAPESPPVSGRLRERTGERREGGRHLVVHAPERSNIHGGVQAGSAPATLTEASATEQGAVDTGVAISVEQVPGSVARGTQPARGERYTVEEGDSLWSIAQRLLGRDATNGKIAREVDRLWRLNEERIGTGSPSLLPVGTVLRLR
jgi:LysM repeat protein